MIKITGYDKPMQVLYMAEARPYGYYRLKPICPRCKNALCGDEKRCPFCNQEFIWSELMSTNPEFIDFVVSKFDELKIKFKLKNEQYKGSNADALANFRIGAKLKYGDASYEHMYECSKDYVRKHIAYIESHDIMGKTVQDSLTDIATYAVIMLYMRKCADQQAQQEK